MTAVEAMQQLRVSFGDPLWMELLEKKKNQEQQQEQPEGIYHHHHHREEDIMRRPKKILGKIAWSKEVRVTRGVEKVQKDHLLCRKESFEFRTASSRRERRSSSKSRASSVGQIALAAHLAAFKRETSQSSIIPIFSKEQPNLRFFDGGAFEEWKDRAHRAKEKREKIEEDKARRTLESLLRPERRREKEVLKERQKKMLEKVFVALFASFFADELEADHDRAWAAASFASNALGGTPMVLAEEEKTTDTPKTVVDEETKSQRRKSSFCLGVIEDIQRRGSRTRRGSLGLVKNSKGSTHVSYSAKALAIQRRRIERIEKAVKVIRKWWFDRKVRKTLGHSASWVPTVLRSFVRLGETSYFTRKRCRCADRIRAFLLAVKRSGVDAIRRLLRAVKKVQVVIRSASQCRKARVTLLERAFAREEKRYRDFLAGQRKRNERLALKRMFADPIFGHRTQKLFDAKEKMRHLLFEAPAAKRIDTKLKHLRRRQLPKLTHSSEKKKTQRRTSNLGNDDSLLRSFPVAEKRRLCEAILKNQRRRHCGTSLRHCGGSYEVNVNDVRDLFFGDQAPSSNLCALCEPSSSKNKRKPFLLLTPEQGALQELRHFIHHNNTHQSNTDLFYLEQEEDYEGGKKSSPFNNNNNNNNDDDDDERGCTTEP